MQSSGCILLSPMSCTPDSRDEYLLPDDILVQVFHWCIFDGFSLSDYADDWILRPPLTFTEVCRSWRQLALTDTTLWSHFSIENSSEGLALDVLYHGLKLWLHRSGNSMLHFDINLSSGAVEAEAELMDLLKKHRHRWKTVIIFMECAWDGLITLSDMPNLVEMNWSVGPTGTTSTERIGTIDITSSKRLRSLEVHGSFSVIADIPVCQRTGGLAQIAEFKHFPSRVRATPCDYLEFLPLASYSLQSLELSIVSPPGDTLLSYLADNSPTLRFSNLRNIRIDTAHGQLMESLLSILAASPSLKFASFSCLDSEVSSTFLLSISRFLRDSSSFHVEYLYLDYWPLVWLIDDAELHAAEIDILRLLPSLKFLALNSSPIQNSTIRALSFKDQSGTPDSWREGLCPLLENIYLYESVNRRLRSWQHIPGNILYVSPLEEEDRSRLVAEMIQSRWNSPTSKSKLRQITLPFDCDVYGGFWKDLDQCMRQGLRIATSNVPPCRWECSTSSY